MKQGIIPEPLFFLEVDGIKDLQDLIVVEESDEGFLKTLLGKVEDHLCRLSLIGVHKADHLGKGFQGGESMVAGPGEVFSLSLEIVEKGQDETRGEMFDSERSDFDAVVLCSEGQKELEGIPVGFDGMGADPFDVGKILAEELMDKGVELHRIFCCQREKSTRFLRLMASATLR